jgi:predicted NAD-dependent protein-ADP-ribosyltransferase YbiA (DUF1768 family)
MNTIIVSEHDWLRNDYRENITIGGKIYPTVEHAYQAAKTKDNSIKTQIADAETVREARKLGKSVPQDESFDREAVMNILLRLKFKNQSLAEQLVATGNAPIVMEGYDDFWGTDEFGGGQNMMGEILQDIRSEFQFIYGIQLDEPEDEDEPEEEEPTLKDAILGAPDDDLAEACQKLFDTSKVVVSMLDSNDFNAEYISGKTGVSIEQVKDAIVKVREFQTTITAIEDLLKQTNDEDCCCGDGDAECCCGCSCDDDDDDPWDDEWID